MHSYPLGVHQALSSDVESVFADGLKLRNQGNIPGAIKAFSRAVGLADSAHDHQALAKALISLGIVQVANLQYRSAFTSYERSAELCKKLGNAHLAGSAAGNLATLYSQVGDWPSAEAEAAQAILYFRRIANPDARTRRLLARALQSHAYLCFFLKRNSEGYAESSEALTIAESLGDLELQSLIWDVRGAALTLQKKITEADVSLRHAIALSEKLRDRDGLAFAMEHLAELELERNQPNWPLALHFLKVAEQQHSSQYEAYPRYIPVHLRARILLGSGNKMAALGEFGRAVTVANEWRQFTLPGDATKTMTTAALQDVYADYAHLAAELSLSQRNKQLAVSGLEALAQNRAANLRDQIRLAYSAELKLPDEYYSCLSQLARLQAHVTLGSMHGEERAKLSQIRVELSQLENQIGIKPEKLLVAGERNPRRNSLSDIQRTLMRDQVLISISLGKGQSYLWAVTGDQVHLSRLAGESQIAAGAERLKVSVQAGQEATIGAADLSAMLFSGLPADTWNRSEWLIVADGALLDGIPFCALPKPGTNERLIERRNIRFLPSEWLLLDRQTASGQALNRQTNRGSQSFIGVGDPIYNIADSRLPKPLPADARAVTGSRLARLPGSEQEIQAAATQVGAKRTVLLTGAEASKNALDSALKKGADIIHFAVHVVSPQGQPREAALALSIHDGFSELLTAEVVASLHVPGSMVVLSGCSSGQGEVVPGSGLMGLSRAWLLAGASAVVVSSWPTLDDTGKFFAAFYRNFERTKARGYAQKAAMALRITQVEMLHGAGYQASPSFWGAFAVISKN